MSNSISDGNKFRLIPEMADIHPWLITAIVVMSLGARNVKWVTLTDVLVVLGLAWLTITLCFVGILFVRRSIRHASLMTTCLGLMCFYYGIAFDAIARLPLAASEPLRHFVLLAVGLGLTAVIAWTNSNLKPLCHFVTLTCAITLAGFGFSFAQALWNEPDSTWTEITKSIPPRTKIASEDQSHPDIYYLVLDGYAREDVLAKYYDFDNSSFLNGLRKRGFYVADKSCTNYPATVFSLPSSLNMRYHEPLDPCGGLKPLAEMVRTNEVGLRLRERGYEIVHFNTRFIATATSDIADISLGEQTYLPAGSRMMLLHLIDHGILRFVNGGQRGIWAAQHRRALAELPLIPKRKGAQFTFLHLIAPHPPFVFTADGELDLNLDQDDRDSYVGQIEYLNDEVTRVIDDILANSSVPPIIVIQSDHGAGFCRGKVHPDESTADEYLQERVPILNAYFVPDAMREDLYSTITPVNTFRLLLSECFGYDYKPLPDRMFVFHRGQWATFAEITDQIHSGNPAPSVRRPELEHRPVQLIGGEQSIRTK